MVSVMNLLLKPTKRKVTEFSELCYTMVILSFEFLHARLLSDPVLLWSQIRRNVRKKYVTAVLLEVMNGAVKEEASRLR
jgi:hypothetical protein